MQSVAPRHSLAGDNDEMHLHFRDLRGVATTFLAEAGATAFQMAAITGHTLQSCHQFLAKDVKKTEALGDEAMNAFERSKAAAFASQAAFTGVPR